MKLIVISDTHLLEKEHDIINALFEAGVVRFHLRKPYSNPETLENMIKQIQPAFLSRVVLHDHYHLAFRFGLGGIHLPEAGRIKISSMTWLEMVQKAITHHLTLSTSMHDKEALKQTEPQFDYVFFSPVFSSISKPGYKPAIDMDVKAIRIKPEIIGLGGVNASSILQLKRMGYDGAAVLGAIWRNPEKAVESFNKIQQACQNNVPMF